MRLRWLLFAAPVLAAGIVVLTPSFAFDHRDTERTTADTMADIADVFSFMRPQQSGDGGFLPSTHLVMVMTFVPGISATQTIDPKVDYVFQLHRVSSLTSLDAPAFKVICNFTNSTPQQILCNVNGFAAISTLETVDGGATNDVRVWAGRASDPAFADVDAFRSTVSTGQNKFTMPGTNKFQGQSVMAIVVELNVKNVINQGDAAVTPPMLAVSGETVRN